MLRGIAELLFAAAVLSFLIGGLVISALTKTERILAELSGLVLTAVCGGLGAFAKATSGEQDEGDAAEGARNRAIQTGRHIR